MLSLANECGKVCIVTNSETGWVALSCKMFMPNIYKQIKNIDIVSARSRYQDLYPNNPAFWKVAAMQDCVQKWFRSPDVITDFISFGDSTIDRLAAKTVGKKLSIATTKSVKFCETPTIEQLCRQQQLLFRTFPHLCTAKDDLDMMLTIKFTGTSPTKSTTPTMSLPPAPVPESVSA